MSSSGTFLRAGDRAPDEMRPVRIETDPLRFAEGSALIEMGDTRVLIAATVEHRVPPFLIDSGSGWATAEYAMLPRATRTRSVREVKRGRQSGRSAEIQRLIGRSLRAVMDLKALPERTLILDCDVLQADGGTRTAAITGAYVAAAQALGKLFLLRELSRWPLREQVAAVSAGIVEGRALLDLEASEDQSAEVDMNVVATSEGRVVEVQGTGERRSFTREELDRLLEMSFAAVETLCDAQRRSLESLLEQVDEVRRGGRRRKAEPKDEADLWGGP